MSGIYIPNMEMPKEGQEILISAGITGTVYARLAPSEDDVTFEKDCWHKVVPVPPHGRLIDADRLTEHDGWMNEGRERNVRQTHITFVYSNDIANAPTIIEADTLPVLHGTFAATSKEEAIRRLTGEGE